jgi:hypothetical protein
MPYELESELELELEGAYGPGFEWEDESEWERSPGCPSEASLKLVPSKPKALTLRRIRCPKGAEALGILRPVIASAVKMLDTTIGELVRAREAVCRGEPMVGPSDLTRCWLRYRLGVCIDDVSTWTKGSVRKVETEPTPVAEVIRRLVGPRNLLANNEITYICETNRDRYCDGRTNAHAPVCPRGRNFAIHLCPRFWIPKHVKFREQTIIHEAVHLTHCARGDEDRGVKVSIGSLECLAQFVVATN